MARYYCPDCGTEYAVKADMRYSLFFSYACKILSFECKTELIKLPDYETPDQYEKRTGKKWPEYGAVFYFVKWRTNGWVTWSLINAKWATRDYQSEDVFIVCAQSPEPPPNGWRPEE